MIRVAAGLRPIFDHPAGFSGPEEVSGSDAGTYLVDVTLSRDLLFF